ncbi:GH12 family glycosyl hydrolase domain-containing protein, partial [Micromonospora carbonacea]|uniref:GH12 family glycosyl hydrolase domain-containing protein n=1 Tax=Micromonospora carbonacea TaxID=47853 RepID=UPI00346BF632
MIWLYRSNASPAGCRQGTVTIAGTTWEIWRGYVGTWNVYSYVRTSNTTNANLNIRDFTNDLVSRGWMSSSKYLTSVQAGPEIFHRKRPGHHQRLLGHHQLTRPADRGGRSDTPPPARPPRNAP